MTAVFVQLRLACILVLCNSWNGKATNSRSGLLARTKQSEFLQGLSSDQADTELGIGAALGSAPQCDVSLSGAICFANAGRRQPLMPSAVQSGLVGHWSFDSEAAIDSSGNGNHGITELIHGPSPAGGGHSAQFTKNFMMVPGSPQLKLNDFTYSFWIYLADDGTTGAAATKSATWCPLLRKGVHMEKTQQFANSPALLFNHRTGHLRTEITTTVRGNDDGEHIDSNARLMPNRWLHVSVVYHSKHPSLLLYVNGILDSVLKPQGTLSTNDYPLYVGGDPFTQEGCGFTVYMDELRIYSHAVAPHLLAAEAAPALGGTDPSYVRLGCIRCNLLEAAKSCPKDRHICTSVELHTGGYQVARSLGWLTAGAHVWTHASVVKGAAGEMASQGKSDSSGQGIGLCCEGPP